MEAIDEILMEGFLSLPEWLVYTTCFLFCSWCGWEIYKVLVR